MVIAAAAGFRSNLELTVPLILIGAVMLLIWDDMLRHLQRRLREDQVDAEWDEEVELADCFPPYDEPPPLRLVHESRPEGVVERRPEDRERARRRRARARLSRPRTRGKAS